MELRVAKNNIFINSITKQEKNSLPKPKLTFYTLFWIFFIGCILGVVLETIYCYIILHRIESRSGVIYGPFNPVYGFGAVALTLLLYQLQHKKPITIFAYSMLIGAIFEYLCSLFQEKAFGTVSWEYSDTFLNFAGRTNLFYAIAWGFLGLFWMKIGFPILGSFLEKIPKRIAIPITTILLVFMIFNLTISSMAAIREQERRHRTSSRY